MEIPKKSFKIHSKIDTTRVGLKNRQKQHIILHLCR
jgi:hypothetical protein